MPTRWPGVIEIVVPMPMTDLDAVDLKHFDGWPGRVLHDAAPHPAKASTFGRFNAANPK